LLFIVFVTYIDKTSVQMAVQLLHIRHSYISRFHTTLRNWPITQVLFARIYQLVRLKA